MSFAVGSLIRARGREWVVLPESGEDLLIARPLGGTDLETAGIHTALEAVESATFELPSVQHLGDHRSCRLLWDAVRLGFRSSAGPFRSFARINVEPRPYQLVPLLMALRLDPVRLLIADDVGIGKTIETCLIVREMLDRGEITRFSVLCPPHLAEQWQRELKEKFHIDAERVLPSTISRLERQTRADQLLFEVFPYTVVSTDFIKNIHRREQFIRQCPALIIVDEAHTCALGGLGTGRQQRHDLIRRLSSDPKRHVLLVTATPHSGDEQAFRSLLTLLDANLTGLPENLGGDENRRYREQLARHMVQRRRADIRQFNVETPFPDRQEKEDNYKLSPAYQKFLVHVLNYARRQVESSGEKQGQRVRWWSMLALLRAMASSPAAAAATLRNRAAVAKAETPDQIDEIGKRSVLDLTDDEAAENLDITPGADIDDDSASDQSDRRRLREMAQEADALAGHPDNKLLKATTLIGQLLADGFQPIVFCRFIHTAEYVAEWLRKQLPKDVVVDAVTGLLPPEDRESRVEQLGQASKRVLVCTDCLSEGINLQSHFNAIFHYDLSWNPTRHEQREGRVDRYGQESTIVRVCTYYGVDNQIDGLVLDVLIKKHRSIRSSLGISVPVPVDNDQVIEAIFKGLLLRNRDADASQLSLFSIDDLVPIRKKVHDEWQSAAERESRSRTIFAQNAMKVDEVALELRAVRDAIGSGTDVARFVRTALGAHGATVTDAARGNLHVELNGLNPALRDQLGINGKQIDVRFELPVHDGVVLLTRTHPLVEKLAGFTLDTALDPQQQGIARRAGVVRTRSVSDKTMLILLRLRYQIFTGKGSESSALLAEDTALVGFTGTPQNPQWLKTDELESLLGAEANANVNPDLARDTIEKLRDAEPLLRPYLEQCARTRGETLLEAHNRVRRTAQVRGMAPRIEAKLPLDILGLYVYFPMS